MAKTATAILLDNKTIQYGLIFLVAFILIKGFKPGTFLASLF